MPREKILICGAAGFIGRNMLEHFARNRSYQVYATYFKTGRPSELAGDKHIHWVRADLRRERDVQAVVKGMDIIIQAAATTSGAKDILSRPYIHVTDNAVMNSLIFRASHAARVRHLIFFSCTVMYPQMKRAVKEEDFDGNIIRNYFGAGWTKVYLEKMCEFYSRAGETRYTVIRHSNIYGPHDKYDLERSHVFGASVAKVMTAASQGKILVWGDGSEERDLLHVDDLVRFVGLAIKRQKSKFECVNVGLGHSVPVRELIRKIIRISGRTLTIAYDRTKPSVGFKLKLNSSKAYRIYGWKPRITLDQGIRKTLSWYRRSRRCS